MDATRTRSSVELELDRLRPLFLAAFPDEADTLARIETEVRRNRAFVAFSRDGKSFGIFQPVRDLHAWTVGGDMAGVMEIEETVSTYAAKNGFDRMTALPSRPNWDRALRDRGWVLEPTAPLVKEV